MSVFQLSSKIFPLDIMIEIKKCTPSHILGYSKVIGLHLAILGLGCAIISSFSLLGVILGRDLFAPIFLSKLHYQKTKQTKLQE